MKYIFYIGLIVSLFSCDKLFLGHQTALISLEENLLKPPLQDDGWEVSTMEAQNIKPEPIQTLIKNLQTSPRNIHSLLIFRNNKMVSESYFDSWHRHRLHATRSASKSFISTLVGIAIDQGKIKNVNEKIAQYFPEYPILKDAKKSQITIKDLLTMTNGLDWNEETYPADDIRNDEYAFDINTNRLGYLFNKTVVAPPSTIFEYNSANPVVETAILQKVTGLNAKDFAQKYFFEPLEIKEYYWRNDKDGYTTAVGPILLKPRDFAKLGQLFLDGGQWKGKQIVSKHWVNEASTTFIGSESNATAYGYHWWAAQYSINNVSTRVFFAQGSGGQYIYVIPRLNAVVVFTGGNYPPNRQGIVFGMLSNIILPAML
jgi:CubicO group peptidase (beta-lactamase class C family)